MIVDFVKRKDISIFNTYYEKEQHHKITNKRGNRNLKSDYTVYGAKNTLNKFGHPKALIGKSEAKLLKIIVCTMKLLVNWPIGNVVKKKLGAAG